jgi:hypothetical protein
MSDALTVEVIGDKELIGFFKELQNIQNSPKTRQAFLDSAVTIEGYAKQNLTDMIYSMPESWYHRTHELFQTTQASGKVNITADTISTEVESKRNYAVHVHFGTGIYAENGQGRKEPWIFKDEKGIKHWTKGIAPNPYLTKALKQAKDEVMQILKSIV